MTTAVPHIPALRRGRPYTSLDQTTVVDCRTGEPRARVSQVNAGIVRRDLQRVAESRTALAGLSVAELIGISARAGEWFLHGTLPLGESGTTQNPQQYVEMLSATSGLPWVMIRRNMEKIHTALTQAELVLRGLTRGLEMQIIDRGFGRVADAPCSFYAVADALGLVMPSNSPAVNSLWLPSIALKIPVMLKPGKDEPWTPFRLIQAFIAAGCPPEAFGFYPTDHEGAGEIMRQCGRSLIFGDRSTTEKFAGNPGVQVHGPGFSKILIGEDEIDRWPDYLDLMVASIADNGGRSCINASAVVVPRCGREVAAALADRLGAVEPRSFDDPNARLSAFANPKMALGIDEAIERDLTVSGARDATASVRGGPRRVVFDGATFLRPTIVECDSWEHPLANREFLFPYASVVETPQAEMLSRIGPSLVVTAITRDEDFRRRLLSARTIDRLNLGAVPTTRISWDQPHEGNLFDFLYRRRSLEIV